MPQKPYRGANTGNSLQKYPSRTLYRYRNPKRCEDTFIVTSFDNTNRDEQSVTVGGCVFQASIPYSTKKHRRWILPDLLKEQLESGRLHPNKEVEVVECELDCYQRPRPTLVSSRKPGEEAEVRTVGGGSAFVNRDCLQRWQWRRKWWYDSDYEEADGLIFDFLHMNSRSKVIKRHRRQTTKEEEQNQRYYAWLSRIGQWSPQQRSRRKREKYAALHTRLCRDLEQASEEEAEEEEEAEVVLPRLQLSDYITLRSPKRAARKRNRSQPRDEPHPLKERKVFCLDPPKPPPKEEEEEEEEEERAVPEQPAAWFLEDLGPSVLFRADFLPEHTSPEVLFSHFGESYIEGDSLPRRFAVRLGPQDSSFLIFEQAPGESRFDVLLNVDAAGESPSGLRDLVPASCDLPAFVRRCEEAVCAAFENRFQSRDHTALVLLPNQRAVLTRPEPTLTELPEARIPAQPALRPEGPRPEQLPEALVTCDICWEEAALGTGASCLRTCRHAFCNGCWRRHLAGSVREGLTRLRCPASKCPAEVGPVTALRFLPLPVFAPFAQQRATDRLLQDPRVTLCPNLLCRRPVRTPLLPPEGGALDATCVCRERFCFSCREEAHWPASCRMYRQFKAKMMSLGDWGLHRSTTVLVLGKNCPACGRFIEKNGGCNSMVCLCGLDFCWQCSMPIEDHDENEIYICGNLEGREVKPRDLQHKDVVYSFCHPDAVRPRPYCSALRLRMDRLRHKAQRQMEESRLRELLYKADLAKTKGRPFERQRWDAIRHEAQKMTDSYAAILRTAEFCHVTCFALGKRQESQRFVQEAGELLQEMAAQMRDLVEGEWITGAEQRVAHLRTVLQQARRRINFVRSLRVLTAAPENRQRTR